MWTQFSQFGPVDLSLVILLTFQAARILLFSLWRKMSV